MLEPEKLPILACQKCGLETVDVRKRDDGRQLCDLCIVEPPHIIKGCPRDKWEEVQAIQHEPFIYIMSNGSHWMGEEESDIQDLAEMLRNHTLDPRFDSFYSANPCHGVEDPNTRGNYIDGPRMYSAEGVYRFFGNFLEYSHVFNIDTNDRPTIELLTSLIDANVNSEAYKQAQAEMIRLEQERKQREAETNEKRRQDRIAAAKAVLAEG